MERKGTTAYLDGLRGLAAFIVVLHHYASGFFPSVIFGDLSMQHLNIERYIYGTPLDLVVAGNFAVCIFFVLSGFVLSYKFFHGSGNTIVASSALRRYVRLMPAVFGAVMIAYIFMKLGLFNNLATAQITASQGWLGTFWNFPPSIGRAVHEGLLGTFMDGTSFHLTSLWTMHYEFFGSFIVFGFLAIFGTMNHRTLIYLMAALAFYNSYFLAFIAGIWICDNHVRLREQLIAVRSRYLAPLLIVLGLALGSVPIPSSRFVLNLQLWSGDTAMALFHIVGATLLILGLLNAPRAQALLMRRPFLYLGRISFSLYLLHIIVLGSLSTYLFNYLILSHSYAISFLVMVVPSLVLILLVSYFYTVWVDERAVVFSGYFYRRIFKAPPKVAKSDILVPITREDTGGHQAVFRSAE